LIRFRTFAVLFFCALAALNGAAQQPASHGMSATGNSVVLVLPFQNQSKAPGLEWIGEAFAEVLSQRLESPRLFLIRRDDRLYAFDRVGIPANAPLSRATLLRIAEQMDVDYVVMGSFDYDGNTFSATAQLLNMRRLHLGAPLKESGGLLQLAEIQGALAWDLHRAIDPRFGVSKQDFVSETRDIRLDALENYVRGTIAASTPEKIRRLKEAVRLNPDYAAAQLELGKAYYQQRDFPNAIAALSRVPPSDKHALEAAFYLGLSAYYSGNLDRADQAFAFVASRLPLTEVYNNLGVVEARRGKSDGIQYLERAVQADPTEEDYHFNLAVSLARSGDSAGAAKQLREALNLRPNDAEAKNYLEAVSAGGNAPKPPLERIKRNYDEAAFRQLAFAVESAEEAQMANANPKKHAQLHVQRGEEQLQQGFYEDAANSFREAVSLAPEAAEAHLGLARADLALNHTEEARSELNGLIASHPTAEAYVILAQVDIKDGKSAAARDDVNQALQLDASNAEALKLRDQIAAAQEPK
jgi:tetratricopeptide (TPR) repeat protein